MTPQVLIYGKPGCPWTLKAREAYGDKARFIDVLADPAQLERMLELSAGRRRVPVIVENDEARVGFGGGS